MGDWHVSLPLEGFCAEAHLGLNHLIRCHGGENQGLCLAAVADQGKKTLKEHEDIHFKMKN